MSPGKKENQDRGIMIRRAEKEKLQFLKSIKKGYKGKKGNLQCLMVIFYFPGEWEDLIQFAMLACQS